VRPVTNAAAVNTGPTASKTEFPSGEGQRTGSTGEYSERMGDMSGTAAVKEESGDESEIDVMDHLHRYCWYYIVFIYVIYGVLELEKK